MSRTSPLPGRTRAGRLDGHHCWVAPQRQRSLRGRVTHALFRSGLHLTGQRAKRTGEPGHSSLRRPWGVVMQNADVAAAIDNASNLVVKTVRALISTAMRRYGS